MLADALQLAMEHHQAGRLTEAESAYRQVLEADPRNANALHLMGVLAQQQGRSQSAVDWIEKALRAAGPHALLLNDLAKAYFELKRTGEAKKCLRKALSLKPDYAEAHGNLGALLAEAGELREAVQSLRRAVALEPTFPNAHFNLGSVLWRLGELKAAEASYRSALALDPKMVDAHVDLGAVLEQLGEIEHAEASYRRALEISPESANAHSRLGALLKAQLRLEEAEASYRAALRLRPSAEIQHALGNVLYDLDKSEEAEEAYRRATELDPELIEARWAHAIVRALSLDGAGLSAEAAAELRLLSDWFRSRRIDDPSRAVGTVQPFDLAYREKNYRELMAQYGQLCSELMGQWWEKERFRRPEPAAEQALRIGIVSAHIHDHSVWNAIVKGWVRHMDRNRIRITLFHLGTRWDAETEFASANVERFEQGPRSLRQWVEAILSSRPDALIYPEIGMDPLTVQLASLRIAPAQLAAWGHPLTTGLPTIDWYLSAELFEPHDAQECYTERLRALPNLGCCYPQLSADPVEVDPAEMGIEPGTPLLLCPGAPVKYSPAQDWIYPEIARRVGNCKFVFFELNPKAIRDALIARLKEAFARAQLDYDRFVVFLPPLTRPAFFGMMKRADVFLDTIGFSGFNTAMQAVECALPIVAREGLYMRGRFASGILRRIGMQEWVAGSDGQYINLAVDLAKDAERRKETRARIEAARHVLFDDLAPVRALENFLFEVARR